MKAENIKQKFYFMYKIFNVDLAVPDTALTKYVPDEILIGGVQPINFWSSVIAPTLNWSTFSPKTENIFICNAPAEVPVIKN